MAIAMNATSAQAFLIAKQKQAKMQTQRKIPLPNPPILRLSSQNLPSFVLINPLPLMEQFAAHICSPLSLSTIYVNDNSFYRICIEYFLPFKDLSPFLTSDFHLP